MNEIGILQWALSAASAVLFAVSAFMMKRIFCKVDKLESDLVVHKMAVAQHYITRTEVMNSLKELKEWMIKIDSKLDGKADK